MDEIKTYTSLPDVPRLQETGSQNFLTAVANTNHLLSHETTFHPPSHSKKLSSSHQQVQSPSVLNSPPEPSNDNHRDSWYHQSDEANVLIYGPNTTKLLDSHTENYMNSRYNVKGIRNERTSFFDIPPATHPYCYRFASPTTVLKKEPEDGLNEDKIFPTHTTSLHLGHHFHHHIQYPDSTTNTNTQQIVQPASSSSPPDFSYPATYTLRTIDSAIVSSTEPDITFGNLYATNNNVSSNNTLNQRRGSLQLWQFLVALLDEPSTSSGCIAWTGRGMEFKLIEPEEVARRWGLQKNRPAMNYDKLSRSLRYYYEKGIMQKVAGERYVYKFVCDPEALFNMAYGHNSNTDSTYSSSCKTSIDAQNANELDPAKGNSTYYNTFQNTLK